MSFSDDIRKFNLKVENLTNTAFVAAVAEAKNSIVHGSPLTGSQGQPVADEKGGTLRASWQTEFTDPHTALISTNSPYAPQNEDGIARPSGGPYVQRSSRGGRWSVALTILGWQRIVDDVATKLSGGSGS